MGILTGTAAAREAIKESLGPALETLDENVHKARRAIVKGRHRVEDAVAGAALQVRRHPLSAVALAAGAGAVVGCVIGFVAGRRRTPF